MSLLPWSVCSKVQWNGQILVSHNVFAEPMFDLCRESGVAEKRKCQGLVPFGNGAIECQRGRKHNCIPFYVFGFYTLNL